MMPPITKLLRRITWVLVALLLIALFGREAVANTHAAASCNSTDVQTAINSAVPGDTVIVPAGAACNWSAGLSISGISLIGAGKSTSGTVITAGTVTMTKHATQLTRLSGFRFTGADVHVSVSGNASSRAYIIDTNYFYSNGTSTFVTLNANGGLLHHNDFFTPVSSGPGADIFAVHPNEDWSQATTFGTADRQGPSGGERNIYFENNTFTNILETAPDGDQGARLVIRYNTYTDSSIVFHAGGPLNDTSTYGTRQFEIYNNTFSRVSNTEPLNKWVWARGSSGVIANNVMDKADSPDGSSYGGKIEIRLGIGCSGLPSWPIQHQIGQTVEPATPPVQPLLIFGNTGAGTTDSNFIVVNENGTGGSSNYDCSSPGTYVQAGRDYMTSNTWGWTPFTYPHPLAGLGTSSLPAAPSSLSATVQ